MTKAIPTIQKYMTTSPLTVGREQTIAHAAMMMDEVRARHLPVLDGGRLVGLISERDIVTVQTIAGANPGAIKVEDAMQQNPYTVEPDAPLDRVAAEMAEKKYGSAVVMQNQKVVGIFTAVDGLAALAELLHTRLGK